jgi:hypothetical protein
MQTGEDNLDQDIQVNMFYTQTTQQDKISTAMMKGGGGMGWQLPPSGQQLEGRKL